jgi:hypothetical protein
MRSCSQNTGPTRSTKRLKLTVVIGMDSGSRADNRGAGSPFFLRACVGGVEGIPGSVADSNMLGMRFIAVDDGRVGEPTLGDRGELAANSSGEPCGKDIFNFKIRSRSLDLGDLPVVGDNGEGRRVAQAGT